MKINCLEIWEKYAKNEIKMLTHVININFFLTTASTITFLNIYVILISTLYSSIYFFRCYVNRTSTDMFDIKVAHNEVISIHNVLRNIFKVSNCLFFIIFYILIINIKCLNIKPYFTLVYYEKLSRINDIRPLKIPSSSRKPIGQQISHKNIRHSFLTHARKTKRSFITLARINWT